MLETTNYHAHALAHTQMHVYNTVWVTNDLTVYFTDCVYVKCELRDILKWYSILFHLDTVDSLANTGVLTGLFASLDFRLLKPWT